MKRRLLLLAAAASLGCGYAAAQTGAVGRAKSEAEAAADRAEALRRQAAEATNAADRARAEAEALVADIERIEADITAAETRLHAVERLRSAQRARLAEKQQPLVRLTAALQTMAQRPPALALVRPGSVEEMVRVRALLASAMPVVRERTAALRAEAARGDQLAARARDAVAELDRAKQALGERRTALARLEEDRRRRSGAFAAASFGESDRALALTEEARTLAASMTSRRHEAKLEAELAALPGPVLRPGTPAEPENQAADYVLPVAGRLLTGTGEISEAGVHARGLAFATAPGAEVRAPRAGRVAYAGRFRSYGEIVIIDHGGGWTSTLTGLAALRVRPGQKVAAGDPVGRAGSRVGVELRQKGEARPIAPFLA